MHVLPCCLISLCLLSCTHSASPTTVPADTSSNTAPAKAAFATAAGAVTVDLEIADEPAERQMGLMFRQSLAPNAGMVFIFPTTEIHAFWMHNTYIPLDMIFIGEDFKVVGVVANAVPQTDTSRSVGVPSKYVVEVNGGFAAQQQIETDTVVTFENVPVTVAK